MNGREEGKKDMIEIQKYYESPHINYISPNAEMNLVLFSSQEYFKYLYVLMRSIMDNNSETIIHLFIVSFVRLEQIEKFNKFMECANHIVTYYLFDKNELNEFVRTPIKTRTGVAGFLRTIPHLFIEECYERVLFMDVDMIVMGDIYTYFYNLDFEGNYIISPANRIDYESYNKMVKSNTYSLEDALSGKYFNSALVLFNLKKMRDEIPLTTIMETLKSNPKIENEQHLLNVLYCNHTKYLNPEEYHNRWSFLLSYEKISEGYMRKVRLFHYDPTYVPFKPWDIYFEDDSMLSKVNNCRFRSYGHKFGNFVINNVVLQIMNIWWEYAKKTPVYDELYTEMQKMRFFIYTYFARVINGYNYYSNMAYQLAGNSECDYKMEIFNLEKTEQTWLNAVNAYYGEKRYLYNCEGIDYKQNIFSEYIKYVLAADDFIVLMSCRNNINYLKEYSIKINGFNVNFTSVWDESYVAVIDVKKKYFEKKNAKSPLALRYTIEIQEDTDISISSSTLSVNINSTKKVGVLLQSEGMSRKTGRSYSSIVVDNLDYARNNDGLNVVVYSRKNQKVVDTFTVIDKNLTMLR